MLPSAFAFDWSNWAFLCSWVYKPHLSNSVSYLSCSLSQLPVGTSWTCQRAVLTSWACFFFFCSSMYVSYYMEVCWEVVCRVKMWWKLKENFSFWPQFFYLFAMYEALRHSQKGMWKQLRSKLLFSSLGLNSSFLCVFWKSCFPNLSFTDVTVALYLPSVPHHYEQLN